MAKSKHPLSDFRAWEPSDVWRHAGIKREQELDLLNEWITVSGEIPASKRELLSVFRRELYDLGGSWNEAELLFSFIAPFLHTINFRGENFGYFSERKLSAVIDNIHVSGYVDWVAASGVEKPITPYFFIHEYKKMRGTNSDPEGQLLIEMVAARSVNMQKDPLAFEKPFYGCFVVGRIWWFVLLKGAKYSLSQGYDASSEEITRIWLILNKTKKIIAKIVGEEIV